METPPTYFTLQMSGVLWKDLIQTFDSKLNHSLHRALTDWQCSGLYSNYHAVAHWNSTQVKRTAHVAVTEPVFQRQEWAGLANRLFWWSALEIQGGLNLYNVRELCRLHWGLFSSIDCSCSIEFTFGCIIVICDFEAKPLIEDCCLNLRRNFMAFYCALQYRMLFQGIFFNPNKVMGLNEISAWLGMEIGGAWFLESAFPCVGGQISWTGASSSLRWCLTRRGHTFRCTPAKLQALRDLPQLSDYFLHQAWESRGSCSPAACLDTFLSTDSLLQGVMETIVPLRSVQNRKNKRYNL